MWKPKERELNTGDVSEANSKVALCAEPIKRIYCRALLLPKQTKLVRRVKSHGGVTSTYNINNIIKVVSYIRIQYNNINSKVLASYFKDVPKKSLKFVFLLLQSICVTPRRTIGFHSARLNVNANSAKEGIRILLEYGYIARVGHTRKLMMLGVYVVDKAYTCTSSGVAFLRDIYSVVGLV